MKKTGDGDAILELHLAWADTIAKQVHRGLPPSFDLADLCQIARLETWNRALVYDPSGEHKGVPFVGYAYRWVDGAVRMAVRRRAYRDNTGEELNTSPVDERPTPEGEVLQREADADAPEVAMLARLRDLLPRLQQTEAYLVQRVYFDGVEVDELAAAWKTDRGYVARRLSKAVRALRKLNTEVIHHAG